MSKNKIIITLGALVVLLPVLGFPTSWESFLEVLIGLSIIATSTWATIDKKLTQKAKADRRRQERRRAHERQIRETMVETGGVSELNSQSINNSLT